VLAEESDLDPATRLDVPVRFEAADPGPGIDPGPAPHDLPGTPAVDSPFDLAFGAGEEVVEDGWPGEDPGHADGAPADLSGIEFREFHVYEGERVVNSTMGDDVEALESYAAVEVRDHRGEDQQLPPREPGESGEGEPIVRDHRSSPLDDFYFEWL
jgi:hypothetical protein